MDFNNKEEIKISVKEMVIKQEEIQILDIRINRDLKLIIINPIIEETFKMIDRYLKTTDLVKTRTITKIISKRKFQDIMDKKHSSPDRFNKRIQKVQQIKFYSKKHKVIFMI